MRTPDRAHLELTGLLVVDRRAGDVGRQKVGRKLNTLETQAEGAGKGFGEGGFADAGNVFDQQVSVGEKHGESQFYDVRLAHDGGFDGIDDGAGFYGKFIRIQQAASNQENGGA